MADTTFVTDVTVIEADWLNDVNTITYDIVNAKNTASGVVDNGTTDVSTEVMAVIDANKGKTIIFTGGTYLLAGIILDGATYNNTRIITDGAVLKLAPDAGSSNFGGAWVGIVLKDCDNVTVDVEWDGNSSAMTASEHIFCMGIAGASNTSIPNLVCNEIRGDGLYISQSDWTSTSTIPDGVHIGSVKCINSTDDGRNAVSVISVDNLHIDSFYSYQVGGTIGGSVMPGGLDIEPNFGYQTVSNVYISDIDITAKTSGCNIFGKAITNDATRDWNCTNIYINGVVKRTGTTGSELSSNNFHRFSDSALNIDISYKTTRGSAASIDYCDRLNGVMKAKNVTYGVTLGASEEVRDFDLHCIVNDYSISGIRTCSMTRGTLKGRVYSASVATGFAIECHDSARGSIVQTNVNYEIDAPFDGNNARAFRNDPVNSVTYVNSEIRNCAYTGYTSPAVTIDAEIPRTNVRGLSYAAAIPTSGTWYRGDVVYNTVPAINVATDMVQLGWTRLTTGSGQVAGTDWTYIYTSTVEPAT